MPKTITVQFICTNKWENGADQPCGCEAAWDGVTLTAEAEVEDGGLYWTCPLCDEEFWQEA